MEESFILDNPDDLHQFLVPRLKVYFAIPLTNVNARAKGSHRSFREAVIDGLAKADGVEFCIYDPGRVTPPGSPHTPADVYRTDHTEVSTADLVIFNARWPSLGVGIEAQISADATVPKIVIAERDGDISPMIDGMFSPTIGRITYSSPDEITRALIEQLPAITRRLLASRARRLPALKKVAAAKLGRSLIEHCVVTNTTTEGLAQRTDMTDEWLRFLRRHDQLAGCLTIMQLLRLATQIGCTLDIDPQHRLSFCGDYDDLFSEQQNVLEQLVDEELASPQGLSDQYLMDRWSARGGRVIARPDSDLTPSSDDTAAEPLTVYLGAPITHVDPGTTAHYREIRRITASVFSEHGFEVRDPADWVVHGCDSGSDYIYCLDHRWTMNADIAFFLVDTPSHGVGIEGQIAANSTIPRIVAHRATASVSRMFLGLFNATVASIAYGDAEDFTRRLQAAMPAIVAAVRPSSGRRRPLLGRIASARIGRAILEQRILKRVPIELLAEGTDITTSWLQRLERHDELAASLSVVELLRLIDALDCNLFIGSGVPTITGERAFRSWPVEIEKSLDNYLEFIVTDEPWKADDKVFRIWEEAEEDFTAVRKLRGRLPTITVDEWRRRYYASRH